MKGYERAGRSALPPRMPVIIRLDGKAFHTWTRGLERPFDERLIAGMDAVTLAVCEEVQGAQIAYVQSDEISILLHNYKRLDTQAWFDNQVQKMVSVAAGIASARMTSVSAEMFGKTKEAIFDARTFVLPEEEVVNYFLWRQQDATRNSIQMVAQSMYSHTELHKKNTSDLQEMIFAKGQNWNELPTRLKRGRCAVRRVQDDALAVRAHWAIDNEPPIFGQDRAYVERHLEVEREERRS